VRIWPLWSKTYSPAFAGPVASAGWAGAGAAAGDGERRGLAEGEGEGDGGAGDGLGETSGEGDGVGDTSAGEGVASGSGSSPPHAPKSNKARARAESLLLIADRLDYADRSRPPGGLQASDDRHEDSQREGDHHRSPDERVLDRHPALMPDRYDPSPVRE
jgi:hypothetical protein